MASQMAESPVIAKQENGHAFDPALKLVVKVLEYAAERDYTGWDYADGMSSALREALPFGNRWVNLGFQEVIKRFPVNLRPIFRVEQRRSFKGAALFALAHHNLDSLSPSESGMNHAAESSRLAGWLVEHRSPGYSGFCGGHQHRNQHLDHQTLPDEPDVVASSYAVKALLAASDYNQAYDRVARSAEAFLVDDMNYRTVDGGAKIDYYPKDPPGHYTLNAGAISARTFLDLYVRFDDEELRDRARKLLDFIVDRQTERGGWYYRVPSSTSHLSMDNHHNGFIIECLQQYQKVTDEDRYANALDRGLGFFRTLFEADGAPNWDESSAYPRDIHAAAQGIIVFTRAGDLRFARQIIDWTFNHLYAGGGRFYFRVHRLYTKRFTLMRWCQAWMAYALSRYLLAVENR